MAVLKLKSLAMLTLKWMVKGLETEKANETEIELELDLVRKWVEETPGQA